MENSQNIINSEVSLQDDLENKLVLTEDKKEPSLEQNKPSDQVDTATQSLPVPENKIQPENKGHRLFYEWSLWHNNDVKSNTRVSEKDWTQSLQKVCSFSSVEDYWNLFDNLRPPSVMEISNSYYLFKKGIVPKWEDENNESGGRWILSFKGGERESCDEIWLFLSMGLVGNMIDFKNDISGVVLCNRQHDFRVSLWTKTASDGNIQKTIGKNLKRVLQLKPEKSIVYRTHGSWKPLYRL